MEERELAEALKAVKEELNLAKRVYLAFPLLFWGAIIFSAILFTLPHWIAFRGNIAGKALAVLGAFIVGLSADHLFAVTHSLLTAFTFHSAANLAGFVVESLGKSGMR